MAGSGECSSRPEVAAAEQEPDQLDVRVSDDETFGDVTANMPSVAEEYKLSRRRFLAVAAFALAEAGGVYALGRLSEGVRTQQTIEAYLRNKLREPTTEQLVAAIPKSDSIVYTISLDEKQQQFDTSGKLNARTLAVGTSNTYALGTMDDHAGPLEQSHSAPQVAVDGLDNRARDTLGLGDLHVWSAAVPGADSGFGNTADPRGLYGVLTQLSNTDAHSWLLEAGSHDLLRVRYETFGLDDLRKLAPDIEGLAGILSDIMKLATSTTLTHDIEQKIDALDAQLNVIASQFGENVVAAADIVAALNEVRRQQRQSEIAFNVIYTWDLKRQDRVPFSAIAGNNDDPRLRHVLLPDRVDPNFPDRYYLDMTAIPYGHELAHWAWAKMFQAQNEALRTINKRYPNLTIVVEQLQGLNENDIFYWVKLPAGKLIQEGDGHPGLVAGEIGGIQQLAAQDLSIWTRRVNGKGEQPASAYARFPVG